MSALLCITRRSPVGSALWLVVTLFALAAMFVLLDAQFIAALQVLVYAGAIMVLFLFVIMLLNLGRPGDPSRDRWGWARHAPVPCCSCSAAGPGGASDVDPAAAGLGSRAPATGDRGRGGQSLFDAYLIPFQMRAYCCSRRSWAPSLAKRALMLLDTRSSSPRSLTGRRRRAAPPQRDHVIFMCVEAHAQRREPDVRRWRRPSEWAGRYSCSS